MAAVGIVGLAIGSAANLRTVLLSVRQRYRHFFDNAKEFDDVVDDLEGITQNLREIEQRMDSRSYEDCGGHAGRLLNTVNKRLVACKEVLDKLGKGPLKVHSGPSWARETAGMPLRITGANRIREKLNKVSASFRHVDSLLGTVTLLTINFEHSHTQGFAGRSSAPFLTHQEVLDFGGKDEYGNLTPEAQLKMCLLDKQSNKVIAAAGVSSGPHTKVQSVLGMAGVGKTVALKGLGWDKEVREAFDEIHYITLGHNATDDVVVAELARIVEISGGELQSRTVRGCKDVNEAVSHTSKWFHGRKCLFLIDDMWETDESNFGYLPALRQLLSTSEGSRMAITTRDRNIAHEAGQAVMFGSRGTATSRRIFLSYFGSDARDASSGEGSGDESIKKILSVCNGVPLVLAVAGRGARALKEEGRSAEDALTDYANILECRQSSVLDESPPSYGRGDESLTLKAAMEISLAFLERRCKSAGITYGMGYAEMYQALGILKAQTWAPLSMLSRLWNVNREDALRIMGQLCTMSLTRWQDHSYKTSSNVEKKESGLMIHDLQLEYCRQHCKEIRSLHGKLLNGYLEVAAEESRTRESDADAGHDGAEDGMLDVEPRPWWSKIVSEDGYLHENVAWHLVNAGRRDELRSLLVDARWVKLRLVIGGILSLENDFAELVRMEDGADVDVEGSASESSDSEFRAILNALRCSWQYVVQNERELALQLGGRLFDVQKSSTAARKLVESAIRNNERPFAEARYGFLPDPRSGQVNEVSLGGFCNSLSYSSCGKYIVVAAGEDVVVVEADTLAEKMRFKGHTEDVSSVCFLPLSYKIISGSWDGTVRIWDLRAPDEDALILKGHTDGVWSVHASADGLRVASGSQDRTVRLWDLQEEAIEGEETKRRSKWMSWLCCSADEANSSEEVDTAAHGCQVLRGHTEEVRCVCFSPDGALLASASVDGTVRLWNSHTHTGITIEGHEGIVSCVAFSPCGERVASGSEDGTIRVWRTDTGAPTGIVMHGHSNLVLSVSFSADAARIVSASLDKTVRVWSADNGAAIGAVLKDHTGYVRCAEFTPDGAHVASVSYGGTLRIWEPENAGEVSSAREGHSSFATCAAFSADGIRIAVGNYDGAICMWDSQSGRAVGGPLEGHTTWVNCLAFSPDGALLASGSGDKTVRLWKVHAKAAVGDALEGHKDLVTKVSFSADGSKLLSYSDDGCRCLWNVSSGTLLWMSLRASEDVVNVMSDTDAQAGVELIEGQRRPDSSNESSVVFYDKEDGTVKMHRKEGDTRLAWLPPLLPPPAESGGGMLWMHIVDRNEFVAVLVHGRPVCLTLHL